MDWKEDIMNREEANRILRNVTQSDTFVPWCKAVDAIEIAVSRTKETWDGKIYTSPYYQLAAQNANFCADLLKQELFKCEQQMTADRVEINNLRGMLENLWKAVKDREEVGRQYREGRVSHKICIPYFARLTKIREEVKSYLINSKKKNVTLNEATRNGLKEFKRFGNDRYKYEFWLGDEHES